MHAHAHMHTHTRIKIVGQVIRAVLMVLHATEAFNFVSEVT